MQRRIDGPDGDRLSVHRLEDAVEVVALHRQQLVERLPAVGLVVGEDHFLHDGNPSLAEEHVLGAAQPDAARAERVGELGLIGQIRVGADAHAPELVRPGQQLIEPPIEIRLLRIERPVDDLQDLARLRRDARELDLARQAVERDDSRPP